MSHLKLVRDAPPKKRRKGTRAPPILSNEVQDRVRAVLRSLHLGHGGWSVVAELTGFSATRLTSIASGSRLVSADLLVRVALAAGVSADALLRQKLTNAGRCPACGAKRAA